MTQLFGNSYNEDRAVRAISEFTTAFKQWVGLLVEQAESPSNPPPWPGNFGVSGASEDLRDRGVDKVEHAPYYTECWCLYDGRDDATHKMFVHNPIEVPVRLNVLDRDEVAEVGEWEDGWLAVCAAARIRQSLRNCEVCGWPHHIGQNYAHLFVPDLGPHRG